MTRPLVTVPTGRMEMLVVLPCAFPDRPGVSRPRPRSARPADGAPSGLHRSAVNGQLTSPCPGRQRRQVAQPKGENNFGLRIVRQRTAADEGPLRFPGDPLRNNAGSPSQLWPRDHRTAETTWPKGYVHERERRANRIKVGRRPPVRRGCGGGQVRLCGPQFQLTGERGVVGNLPDGRSLSPHRQQRADPARITLRIGP